MTRDTMVKTPAPVPDAQGRPRIIGKSSMTRHVHNGVKASRKPFFRATTGLPVRHI